MKVIVSDIIEDKFTEFKVVKDTKSIDNAEDVTTLIYHSSNESDFSVGVNISRLSQNGHTQFFYINKNPQTTIKMVIAGAGGTIITEEFYLDDEEELLELLKSYGMDDADSETSLATASVQVVKDFVQSFVRGEGKIKTPAYLEMVNSAINQLSTITSQQELQITTMGNSAIDIFKKASALIKNMEEQRSKLEQQLQYLETSQESVDSSKVSSFNSNVVMYPPVKYMSGTKPILLIREYSPCRYLTSFAIGYTHHIHFAKNHRVKLIMVHQKGAGVAAKYSTFTSINESSASYETLYGNEFIATNTPTKDIMRQLFAQPVDVFIVVDRLYGSQDIVNGKVSKLNAVGSTSDLDRYDLNPADTIVSTQVNKGTDVFAVLKTVKDYPTDVDVRQASYEQMYEKVYATLDELLLGNVGQ